MATCLRHMGHQKPAQLLTKLGLLRPAQAGQILMTLYTLQNTQNTTQPTYFFSRCSGAAAIGECTSANK